MKPDRIPPPYQKVPVAPRRGAWIETMLKYMPQLYTIGRTPQGCVD